MNISAFFAIHAWGDEHSLSFTPFHWGLGLGHCRHCGCVARLGPFNMAIRPLPQNIAKSGPAVGIGCTVEQSMLEFLFVPLRWEFYAQGQWACFGPLHMTIVGWTFPTLIPPVFGIGFGIRPWSEMLKVHVYPLHWGFFFKGAEADSPRRIAIGAGPVEVVTEKFRTAGPAISLHLRLGTEALELRLVPFLWRLKFQRTEAGEFVFASFGPFKLIRRAIA